MPKNSLYPCLALAAALVLGASALGQQNQRLHLPLLVGPRATPTTPAPGEPAPSDPTPSPQNPLQSGRATYYVTADGGGNCSFAPTPNDLMVAAISHENYSDPHPAAHCGSYVEVFGELGSVVVRIVDKCPDALCTRGHLDLSPQAFAKIAPIEKGIVPISWRLISPAIGGPIGYHFKDGSNQWWTAVQIRDHRNPIATLEYQTADGQWKNVERTDYNYFVAPSGMGPGPYSFRVTDIYGNVLTDSGIPHREQQTVQGSGQFPAGP